MRAWLIALAVCATCAFAERAQAGAHTVTLLGVSGPGGDRFADLLEQDLSEVYEVIPGDVYRAGALRVDKRGAAPNDVRAVARSLRIDAVVGGAISGTGRTRVLAIAVRSGITGRVVARGRYELGEQTLPHVRERVVSDLVRAFERIDPSAKVAEADDEDEPAQEPPVEIRASGELTSRVTRPRAVPNRGLTAGVGLSVFSRRLAFDLGSAPGYRGGTVAGIRADGTVFPFALSAELADAHPILASFGLSGSYEHAFNFSSSTAGATIAGHASRWMILFVGRIPLGHAARGGTLTVETGVQELSWSSDSPQDLGVPNAKYDLVDAGLSWQRELGTRLVSLRLRLACLGLVSSDGISSDAEYGHATGWGIEAGAELRIQPKPWLWLAIEARYTPLVLSFAANGTRLAHSATEGWVSGMLEVGFAL